MTTTKKRSKKSRKRSKTLPGKIVGELNGFPVRRVQVGALTGAKYNPRKITPEALEALGASTERFGLVQPVVWNRRTQKIVGGHQRIKTLPSDEFTDVIEVDLDLTEEKALNLALNNPHAAGEFTMGLADLLTELEIDVPDLVTSLALEKLYTDVPAEVDDLLDDLPDDDKPDEAEATRDKSGGDSEDTGKGDDYQEVKQIVIVVDEAEHARATKGLESVMRQESCENYTEALLWLLESYAKPAKKRRR